MITNKDRKKGISSSKKDMLLLYELSRDARQPLTALAKKTSMSKDAVKSHLSLLEKEGIIRDYRVMVDVGRLGYLSSRFFIRFRNTTPSKEGEIISWLSSKREVTWMVSVEGPYNLNLWVLTRSVREVNSLWQELFERYGRFISQRHYSIFTRVFFFPRSFLAGLKYNREEYLFITPPDASCKEKNKPLDAISLRILRVLAKNARTPIIAIAQSLGISAKTVINKIKLMKERSIIVGYTATLNLDRLGYLYKKLHIKLNNFNREKIMLLKSFIHKHPNIVYDNELLGGYDIEIEVQTKGRAEYDSFIEEFMNAFGMLVESIDVLTYTKEHKFIFLPLND